MDEVGGVEAEDVGKVFRFEGLESGFDGGGSGEDPDCLSFRVAWQVVGGFQERLLDFFELLEVGMEVIDGFGAIVNNRANQGGEQAAGY